MQSSGVFVFLCTWRHAGSDSGNTGFATVVCFHADGEIQPLAVAPHPDAETLEAPPQYEPAKN